MFALVFRMKIYMHLWINVFFSGLLSWNVLDCHVDLEEELNSLTNHAPEGEAARHGNCYSAFFLLVNFLGIILYKDDLYSMHVTKTVFWWCLW